MTYDPAHEFFQHFPIREVHAKGLDLVLAEPDAPPLTVLFLWGLDCPNCDVAKREMLLDVQRYQWPEVRWLHDNVYADPDMSTRFSLHGVPTFFLFRDAKRLGRITSWPGGEAFVEAVEKQIAELRATGGG
jgi:hypothetical protein